LCEILQTWFGIYLREEVRQIYDPVILWATARWEGVMFSKIDLFLSIQMCQQVWAARMIEAILSFVQIDRKSETKAPFQNLLILWRICSLAQTAFVKVHWMSRWLISSDSILQRIHILGPSYPLHWRVS
jgi:hypothetical protein